MIERRQKKVETRLGHALSSSSAVPALGSKAERLESPKTAEWGGVKAAACWRRWRALAPASFPADHGSKSAQSLPAIGFFVTVIGSVLAADLTPASRRQDHTTSPSASKTLSS